MLSPRWFSLRGFPHGRRRILLVTIQFPIADAREFSALPDLRLSLPDWPEPETSIDPQFVRYFGKAIERVGEPDEAWPDEIKFVKATRGLRFDRLETRHSGKLGRRFKPRCAFRRLFCDGRAVARVEIGITHRKSVSPLMQLSLEEVFSIVRDIAEIPTKVFNPTGTDKFRPILSQGKHLARLYAQASMNNKISDKNNSANQTLGFQLVEAGDPVILIETNSDEMLFDDITNNKGITIVKSTSINGAKALFCRLKVAVGIVSVWIIQKGNATEGQLRSLRLCLTRLHAEREVLDLILKQIHRGRLLNPSSEKAVDLLDQYFNERLKVINRDNWGGMKQSEILAAFDATKAVVRPAIRKQLIKRYEGGRLQVWKKIQAFQEERQAIRSVKVIKIEKGGNMVDQSVNISGSGGVANVTNVANVAKYMSNVTTTVNNNLAESNADNEVKNLIKALSKEIESVASKADPAQVKKLGKNLEALSKEAATDEPDRQWYEVSLTGIMDAAKAVGSAAEPVLKIAKKLAAILLV